jgi:alpha(1,3/1,4) fucosyltransferase
MYLGFYNFYRAYNANRMFTDASSPIGDDLGYPTVYLGRRLSELGHRVATIDTDDLQRFDAVIFLDHPTFLNRYFRRLKRWPDKKLYLILAENPANRPDNYWRWNHRRFHKVFTWNPEWVDNQKYFRFVLPNRIPSPFTIDPSDRTGFCVTIASQKYNAHPRELYSERVRAIRWFEQNHPAEFDLYGTQWDKAYFTGRWSRLNLLLQKVYSSFPRRFHAARFPSWKGTVPRKSTVLRKYKYSICYENAVFPGYVTEKLFDSLFAGCVPVYLGAPEVASSVPPQAFVDKRHFRDYEELYRYLKNMPAAEYEGYLSAIHSFVTGDKIRPFSAEYFAQTFIDNIVTPLVSP